MLTNALAYLCRRLHCALLRIRITVIEQDNAWLECAALAAPKQLATNRAKAEALRVTVAALEARDAPTN